MLTLSSSLSRWCSFLFLGRRRRSLLQAAARECIEFLARCLELWYTHAQASLPFCHQPSTSSIGWRAEDVERHISVGGQTVRWYVNRSIDIHKCWESVRRCPPWGRCGQQPGERGLLTYAASMVEHRLWFMDLGRALSVDSGVASPGPGERGLSRRTWVIVRVAPLPSACAMLAWSLTTHSVC